MQKRKLGDLEVSAMGLGCMGMSHSYFPKPDKKDMISLIHKAFDMGINFFDTAEVYGPFENEELVGEALEEYKGKVVIATKFGQRIENGKPILNTKPDTIKKSIEGSLKRLRVDANYKLIELIKDISNKKNIKPAQLALSWVLAQKSFIVPIPGSRNIDRLKENASSVDIILSDDELKDINEALSKITIYGDRYSKEYADKVGK